MTGEGQVGKTHVKEMLYWLNFLSQSTCWLLMVNGLKNKIKVKKISWHEPQLYKNSSKGSYGIALGQITSRFTIILATI